MPRPLSAVVARAETIIAVVSGIAKRLQMRKKRGKVLKRIHTSGAVKIWQEMLNEAPVQIRRRGLKAGPSSG